MPVQKKVRSIDVKKGNRYSAREMVRAVFLLEKSHLKASKEVFEAFQKFQRFAPRDLTYLINSPSGDWDSIDDSKSLVKVVGSRLVSKSKVPNCSLTVISEDSNIPDYAFSYVGVNSDESDFKSWASSITLSVPVETFNSNSKMFLILFMEMVDVLPAFASYVSLSLEGDQAMVQKVANKNPGLDISSVSSITKDVNGKAPGIFWLNAYKGRLRRAVKSWVEKASVPKNVHLEDKDSLLLIQIGEKPDRITVGSKNFLAGYEWLADGIKFIDEFHIPKKVTYFEDEGSIEDTEVQRAWHLRFCSESK